MFTNEFMTKKDIYNIFNDYIDTVLEVSTLYGQIDLMNAQARLNKERVEYIEKINRAKGIMPWRTIERLNKRALKVMNAMHDAWLYGEYANAHWLMLRHEL